MAKVSVRLQVHRPGDVKEIHFVWAKRIYLYRAREGGLVRWQNCKGVTQ
jgi:hypothetical protein